MRLDMKGKVRYYINQDPRHFDKKGPKMTINLTFTFGEELPHTLNGRGARGGKWDAAYNNLIDSKPDNWIKIGGFGKNKDEARRLQSAFHISARKHKTAGNRAFVKHMVSNGFKASTRVQCAENGEYFVWACKTAK